MQVVSLNREGVIQPEALNMNQRALAFAKQQVLQGAEGEQVGLGVHGYFSITVTPSGTASWSRTTS